MADGTVLKQKFLDVNALVTSVEKKAAELKIAVLRSELNQDADGHARRVLRSFSQTLLDCLEQLTAGKSSLIDKDLQRQLDATNSPMIEQATNVLASIFRCLDRAAAGIQNGQTEDLDSIAHILSEFVAQLLEHFKSLRNVYEEQLELIADERPLERSEKIKRRNARLKVLYKSNEGITYQRLADLGNVDDQIKKLGLPPISKETARNAIHPPKSRMKK